MRRRIVIPVSLYLTEALATRAAEAAGFQRCQCSATCWCRKPLLRAFRWVLPVGHR